MRGGTGCSSVGKVLIERFGGAMLPEGNIYQGGHMVFGRKHNDVRQLLEWGFLTENDVKRLFIFTTVRNPYDAVASDYARIVSGWEGAMPRDAHGNIIEDASARTAIRENAENVRQMGFDKWVCLRYGRLARLKSWLKAKVFQKKPVDYLWRTDFVMQFESLENDLNQVLRRNGIDEFVQIPNTNPTQGKRPYQEYYSDDSRRMVQQSFKHIIERFNYTF